MRGQLVGPAHPTFSEGPLAYSLSRAIASEGSWRPHHGPAPGAQITPYQLYFPSSAPIWPTKAPVVLLLTRMVKADSAFGAVGGSGGGRGGIGECGAADKEGTGVASAASSCRTADRTPPPCPKAQSMRDYLVQADIFLPN